MYPYTHTYVIYSYICIRNYKNLKSIKQFKANLNERSNQQLGKLKFHYTYLKRVCLIKKAPK